ncbi:hypothetical protein [Pseudomonas paraveronii]|uniref:hypothetical protein n=1 Tax=Pseudomonas paraveronii TaxID=3040598 RepID=UPI002AB2466C|nr:hypothetical protein [Pseudomonas sp. V3/K/3/5]
MSALDTDLRAKRHTQDWPVVDFTSRPYKNSVFYCVETSGIFALDFQAPADLISGQKKTLASQGLFYCRHA